MNLIGPVGVTLAIVATLVMVWYRVRPARKHRRKQVFGVMARIWTPEGIISGECGAFRYLITASVVMVLTWFFKPVVAVWLTVRDVKEKKEPKENSETRNPKSEPESLTAKNTESAEKTGRLLEPALQHSSTPSHPST